MGAATRSFRITATLLAASLAFAAAAETPAPAHGSQEDESLVRAAQNPVADLISVPVQSNIGFGFGPDRGVQNVLFIQPVIPLELGADWNLITRTMIPIVTMPSFTGGSSTTGLGNLIFTALLSPARPGAILWGVGPVAIFPTATSPLVGSQSTWALGPSVVALSMPGNWVLGALAMQAWSVAGESYSGLLAQYFVNYNLHDGWYLTSSPIITASWNAAPGQKWVIPFGAGAGKIFFLGPLPFNGNVTAYYNAVRPDIGPTWTLRLQLALLLPKSIF